MSGDHRVARLQASARSFECDVCGRRRNGDPVPCRFCGLKVCWSCDAYQARVGHVEAEHAHEARQA